VLGGATVRDWGLVIRTFRRSRGLTQAALAEMLLVDVTTISRWERGLAQPERAMQQMLVKLTGRQMDADHSSLKLAIENSRLPVAMLDADCRWLAVSQGRCQAIGRSSSEIVGHDARRVMNDVAVETLSAFLADSYYSKHDLVYAEFFSAYPHTLPDGATVQLLIREVCELIHEARKLRYVRATCEIIEPTPGLELIERGVFIDGTIGTNLYGEPQHWR
jgi:transcriptional regulator with XRE-family HTH domain